MTNETKAQKIKSLEKVTPESLYNRLNILCNDVQNFLSDKMENSPDVRDIPFLYKYFRLKTDLIDARSNLTQFDSKK